MTEGEEGREQAESEVREEETAGNKHEIYESEYLYNEAWREIVTRAHLSCR